MAVGTKNVCVCVCVCVCWGGGASGAVYSQWEHYSITGTV